MPTLDELATVFRSKNAGPFLITVDLMFPDQVTFQRVSQSEALTRERVGKCYGIDPNQVQIIAHPKANAIKVTLPRLSGSRGAGSPGDRDVYGAQQHGPLLKLNLPDLR